MKIYEKRTKEYDCLIKETCDWCGKDVEELDCGEVNDFDFEYCIGECDYESSWGTKYTFDLCNNCREKLIKLLVDNGINIIVEKY